MSKKKVKKESKTEVSLDKSKILYINNLEIHPNEHPDLYMGRDITKKGKQTLLNATNIEMYIVWIELQRAKIYNEGRWFFSKDGSKKTYFQAFKSKVIPDLKMMGEKDERRGLKKYDKWLEHHRRTMSALKKAFPNKSLPTKTESVRIRMEEYTKPYHQRFIELFGKMFTPKEVQKIAVENWEVPVDIKFLFKFRQRNIDEISGLIHEYQQGNIDDLRLSTVRGRFEEIKWLYDRVKASFIATGSKSDRDFMLKAVESLRKEAGDDIIRINGNLDIKVEQTITHQIQKEIFEKTNLTQIIIGRVAARQGVNPLQIITDMQQNVYAKFNGMLNYQDENVSDVEYEELIYPSAMPYDFNMIEKGQEVKKSERIELKKTLEIKIEKANIIGKEKGSKETLSKLLQKLRDENIARGTEVDMIALDKRIEKETENTKGMAADYTDGISLKNVKKQLKKKRNEKSK